MYSTCGYLQLGMSDYPSTLSPGGISHLYGSLGPHHGPHRLRPSGRSSENKERCVRSMDLEGAIIPLTSGDRASSVALSAVKILCCSRYHVTRYNGCAPYVRTTRGFEDTHGDAHPLDMRGTSRSHPLLPQGLRPEKKTTCTSIRKILK